MGLFTTQKSKEVMQRGLEESTTALEVDGSVTAYIDSGSNTYALLVPIKVAPGRGSVDLSADKVTVRLVTNGEAYENIYEGAQNSSGSTDAATLAGTVTNTPGAKSVFIIGNAKVLEYGEKAVLVVKLPSLTEYQKVLIEIRPPEGSPLTVERTMPAQLPTSGVVDLG